MSESKRQLIIIDDEESFARILLRRLQQHGWDGGYYANVAEAQQEVVTPPEVVLLDLNLAGQSSLTYIRELKACWPGVRIIILTGYASIATTVQAMKDGAENYLAKPVEMTTLLSALNGDDESASLPDHPVSVDALEWELIQRTLQQNGGNVSATARALNMHRRTLQRKLQKRRTAFSND